MKRFDGISLALISITLFGCAAPPPTANELAAADFGPPPKNFRATIISYMGVILKDPESARYGFYIEPVKGYAGRDRQFGWATCAMVNAKNSYGGYTGAKQYFFLIKNDAVTYHEAAEGRNMLIDAEVQKSCRSLQPRKS